MSKKRRMILIAGLVMSMSAASAASAVMLTSCKKTQPIADVTGVYYAEVDGQDCVITLDGTEFTFELTLGGESKSGEYTYDGSNLNLTYDEQTLVAALNAEGVLTVTYNGRTYTLTATEDAAYKVSYKDGSATIDSLLTVNGKKVSEPQAPVKSGYAFIGWYDSADFGALFDFDAETITSDTTIYARYVQIDATKDVFEVTFDAGEGATAPAAMQTINGRIYEIPVATKAGAQFAGWWVSDYNDGEKLTYKYEGQELSANTTLFAVWASADPLVSVTSSGITWTNQKAAATLTVSGPDGFTEVTKTIGASAASVFDPDFANAPEGDYVVTFTVGSSTQTRYYRNKALARVSLFEIDGTTLKFNAVPNAEKYLVTVDCGDDNHTHTAYDATGTSFDFSNCQMQPGGIVFTVVAQAEGYADSVASVYTYEKNLAAVGALAYDDQTDSVSWNAVANATSYSVTVKVDDAVVYSEDIGNKTAFSLKGYTGAISVSVNAKAVGYNSAAPAVYSYEKDALATPEDVRIVGNTLSWNAVAGAESYTVRIGNDSFTVVASEENAPSFDLANNNISWTQNSDYVITVRAESSSSPASYWTDDYDARYYAMYQTLNYDCNTLSWHAVIGATKYEIMINDDSENVVEITDGATAAQIVLTQSGVNKISVRFSDGTTTSEWVDLSVTAYEITVAGIEGSDEEQKIYLAAGDKLNVSAGVNPGYTFGGWYDAASGEVVNGKAYLDEYFAGGEGLSLFANWLYADYQITLDYGEYVDESSTLSAIVTYKQKFILPVPQVTDGRKVFMGWYAAQNGVGIKYTDENGVSVGTWQHTAEGYTLYAYYADGLEYIEKSDGTYAVKAGDSIGKIYNLYIPAEYNGKPVTDISDYAFKSCTSLITVSIPDTVKSIADTAFEGCTKVTKFTVRPEGTPTEDIRYFSTENGTLVAVEREGSTNYLLQAAPLATAGVYVVPDMVTKISQNAFKSMTAVTEVVIPTSVTTILKQAFVSCTKLTTITFLEPEEGDPEPLSLTLAVDFIDVTCTALTTLTLPARLNKIDESETRIAEAFVKFVNLQNINATAGNNYSSIDGVLCNATNGTVGDTIVYCPLAKSGDYVVPTQITKIADYAFCGAVATTTAQPTTGYNKLTSLTFHANVESIGERAFYNNRSVKTIVFEASALPNDLTIGKEAFYWCTLATTITFEEEGAMKSRQTTVGEEEITEYYFEYTKSCGVVSIGEDAFYNCRESALLLPSTLRFVDENAFRSNINLADLDLSHISTEIEFADAVFNSCTKLTSINITENVGYVSFASIFYNCTNLATLQVSADSPYYSTDAYNILYDKNKTKISYCPDAVNGAYVVPDTVKEIGGAVFKGKVGLTDVTIPVSVTEIGMAAFESCVNLRTVTFVSGEGEPLSIGDRAFYACANLTPITLSERTKTIGAYAFYNAAPTAITLNEGLEEIGTYAFYGSKFTSVNLPYTVKKIGISAFDSSKSLASLTFEATPAGETAVDLVIDAQAFEYCTLLTSVVLPERLLYIADSLFYGCTALREVTVPTTVGNTTITNASGKTETVRGVGDKAFYGCTMLATLNFTKLSDIYSGEELETVEVRPLSFGNQAFYNCKVLTTLQLPNRIAAMTAGKDDVFAFYVTTANVMHDFNVSFTTYTDTSASYAFIERIEVEEGGDYASYDGVLYTAGLTQVLFCPQKRAGVVEIAYQATTFAPSAFRCCKLLTGITFQETPVGETAVDFVLNDAYPDNWTPTSTTISLTSYIYSTHAFFGCTLLESIAFPARLTSIGDYALTNNLGSYKTALSSVTFADGCSLATIGKNAFDSTLITSIVLPAQVATVGDNAFANCANLTEITISELMDVDSVKKIIQGVPNLAQLHIPEANTNVLEYNGAIYNAEKTTLIYVLPGITAAEYVVPATVTTISTGAFSNLMNVTKITFEAAAEGATPAALTLEDGAFEGSGIKEIVLPARLSVFGLGVFKNCAALTTVTFEEGYNCVVLPDATFYGCTALTAIEIPYVVTSLGNEIFRGCSSLASVTFAKDATYGNQLQQIGTYAFYNCTSLLEIVLPENVTSLGAEEDTTYDPSTSTIYYAATSAYTFYGCSSLKSVTLPDGIQIIGGYTFYNCIALESVNLPSDLTILGRYAFYGCKALSTVSYGSSDADWTPQWAKIGYYAFYNCTSLQSIELPSSITALGTSIFYGCTSLTTATYKGSFFVSNNMFKNCTSLTTVDLSASSASKIGQYAFNGCSLLSSITIPSTVTTIDAYAFQYCTSLSSVVIPASVEIVGKYAFDGCTGLITVEHNGTGEAEGFIQEYAFRGCTSMTTFTFADNSNVAYIYYYAFDGCSALTSISLPDSLLRASGYSTMSTPTPTTSSYVFRNCSSLREVRLSANLEGVAYYMFQNCTSLESVVFGTDATGASKAAYISTRAFDGCSSLRQIALPASIQSIYGYAFNGCTSLETVTFGGDENGGESQLTTILYYAFQNCTSLKNIALPDSVTQLGGTTVGMTSYTNATSSYVFVNCTSLTNFRIPDGVTIIGIYTFSNCTSLTEVDFNKLQTIGNYAFYNCTKLGSQGMVDISNVVTIGDYAFSGCRALGQVKVVSLNSVGKGAFNNTNYSLVVGDGSALSIRDDGLVYTATEVIAYLGDAAEITIPDGITTINSAVFQQNLQLTKVTLPASVTTLGTYAFDGCKNLVSINLENVTTFQTCALQNCKALTTVDLSKAETIGLGAFFGSAITAADMPVATSVGSQAFKLCESLTSVSFASDCVIGEYAFQSCSSLVSADLSGVTEIGIYAFDGCPLLETVSFGATDKLTKIRYYAFRGCASLTSISLPDSVTILGGTATGTTMTNSTISYVFANCTSLQTVKLPAGLLALGTYTFQNCSSLVSIDLGAVEKFGNYCFDGCSSLTSVTMNALTTFGSYGFRNCESLESVTIPSGVTALTTYLFAGCTGLKSIVIPDTIKTLGTYAFQNCTSLESVTMSTNTSLTALTANIFEGCTALTSIELASNFKTFGANAFLGCTSLATVSLSENFTTIGTNAFDGCASLTAIEIPALATTISDYAFRGCTSLASVTFGGVKVYKIGVGAFEGCTSLTTVDLSAQPLDNNTTTVSSSYGIFVDAFKDCVNLTTVTIGNVQNIQAGAFDNCPNVNIVWNGASMSVTDDYIVNIKSKKLIKYTGTASTFTVPDSVTTVADYAFAGNTTLQTVDLNGVTRLGAYAFADCTALRSIDLSAITTYSYCGTYTFSGCTSLSDVKFYTPLATATTVYVPTGIFQGCTALTSFDFSRITTIQSYAFEGSGITEVNAPLLTSIQTRAFAECASLVSVNAPKAYWAVTTYYEQFKDCVNLETALMTGTSTTLYIPKDAFHGCAKLSSFTCAPVTYVYNNAFEGCASLTSFDFSKTTYVYDEAFKGSGLTEVTLPALTGYAGLKNSAFENCVNLKTVSLPLYTGDSNYVNAEYSETLQYGIGAFKGCTSLESVSMPVAVRIASEMFSGCTSLTTVTAPSVVYIYSDAFNGCSALTAFDFTFVTTIGSRAFKDCTGIASVVLGELTVSIYSSSFAGWTPEQTIIVESYSLSDLSETFIEQWNEYCQATVIWRSDD